MGEQAGRAPFPFRTPVGCRVFLPSPVLASGSSPCSGHLFPRQVNKTGPLELYSLCTRRFTRLVKPWRCLPAVFMAVTVADGAAVPSARRSCRAAHARSPAASSQLSFLPSVKKYLGSHLAPFARASRFLSLKDRGVQAGFAWQTDGGTARMGAEAHSLNRAAI